MQQKLQTWFTEPPKTRGWTVSKKLYSLILIIALSTCIQSLAISWVLETSDVVNSLPPETLQPLLSLRMEESLMLLQPTLLEGLQSKTPYLLLLQILPLTSQEYHINVWPFCLMYIPGTKNSQRSLPHLGKYLPGLYRRCGSYMWCKIQNEKLWNLGSAP